MKLISQNAMKTLIFIIVLICAGPKVNAQSAHYDNYAGSITINGSLTFGTTIQQVVQAFGQPDSTSTMYWEMSELTATYYHYVNGGEFAFVDQKLEGFTITSSNYPIELGSFQLKVGNSINTLATPFPKSYGSRTQGDSATLISLDAGDHRFILIRFNSSSVITHLDLRTF